MTARACDGCTKCCEGWLAGKVNGQPFYKGRPCFFLNKTCTIYESRPEDPCRSFTCQWITEEIFPQWMKPDLANVIITKRFNKGIDFYEIIEAGSVMQARVLNWLVLWALNDKKNIKYWIEGGANKIGCDEFLNANV